MSSRTWRSETVVLSLFNFAESHRNVQLLVPQGSGCTVVTATLFGGAKSKHRGMVAPYQTGTVWLYTNPISNSHKIIDFSVSSYRIELRESLIRTWSAALCSELAINMSGMVDWHTVNAFLNGLCVSDDDSCKRGTLRFLWRLLRFSGIAPCLAACDECDTALPSSATNNSTSESFVVYSPAEESFYCQNCSHHHAESFTLSTEAFTYLKAVDRQPAGYSRHLPLSITAYGELKRLLFFLTEKMTNKRLKTLQTGINIF